MNIRPAIIFDMDGVVIDNYKYHERAWRLFADKYDLKFDDFKKKVFGGTNKDHLQTLFGKVLSKDELNEFANEKESLYRNLYAPYIKPINGLKEFLIALRLNEIPIALATSAPLKNVQFVLEKTKLESYFQVIIDATMVEKGKPDPEVFLKAADKLKIPANNCVVIEDSIHGIKAAKRAGMKVVAIATTLSANEIPDADLIINDFDGLDFEQLRKLL